VRDVETETWTGNHGLWNTRTEKPTDLKSSRQNHWQPTATSNVDSSPALNCHVICRWELEMALRDLSWGEFILRTIAISPWRARPTAIAVPHVIFCRFAGWFHQPEHLDSYDQFSRYHTSTGIIVGVNTQSEWHTVADLSFWSGGDLQVHFPSPPLPLPPSHPEILGFYIAVGEF